jgi:hypothetical protein
MIQHPIKNEIVARVCNDRYSYVDITTLVLRSNLCSIEVVACDVLGPGLEPAEMRGVQQ